MSTWLKYIHAHIGLLVRRDWERPLISLIPYLVLKNRISMFKIGSFGKEMQELFSNTHRVLALIRSVLANSKQSAEGWATEQ